MTRGSEAIAEIVEEMNARARELGSRLVAAERELDRLFRSRAATAAEVKRLVTSVEALNGELRYVHLEAHLRTTSLLGPEQILRYDLERGYGIHTDREGGETIRMHRLERGELD